MTNFKELIALEYESAYDLPARKKYKARRPKEAMRTKSRIFSNGSKQTVPK